MTRPRAQFVRRDGTDYIFAVDTGRRPRSTSPMLRLVRVPMADFWRAP